MKNLKNNFESGVENNENQLPSNFNEVLERMQDFFKKTSPEYIRWLDNYEKYSKGEKDFDRKQYYSEWKDEDFKKIIEELEKYFAENFHKRV